MRAPHLARHIAGIPQHPFSAQTAFPATLGARVRMMTARSAKIPVSMAHLPPHLRTVAILGAIPTRS
jgi:hypothetical protein